MQRLVLACVLLTAGMLYVEPAIQHSIAGIQARTTVAQRYPLRSRSKSFYDRSKVSSVSTKAPVSKSSKPVAKTVKATKSR